MTRRTKDERRTEEPTVMDSGSAAEDIRYV